MKQYDSVYIPTRKMNFGELLELYGCGLDEQEGPIICLTIEELRDMWNAGCQAMDEVNAHEYDEYYVSKRPGFDQYLQSKGIIL